MNSLRLSVAIVLSILIVPAARSTAQPFTGIASVDSAAVARGAYRRALGGDDPSSARREIARAAAAWPTQPAYLWARALLSARTQDTAATLAALTDYANLSLGRDLGVSPDLRSLRGLPAFAKIEERHAAHRAPMARSRVVATFPDSTIWPEGMDHDARSGTYYVASIGHGTVVAMSRAGTFSTLWPRGSTRLGAVLAVRVDTARNVLWATTSGMPAYQGRVPGDSAIASLLRIGLDDRRIQRVWDFPVAARGHMLGDVAIGPAGDVFISDSNHPVVYRLRPGAEEVEPIQSPLFNSAQGLAPTPDGRALYIADYSHGLIRLDLASGDLHRLPDAPHATSLGIDGLVWFEGSLVAIQNGVGSPRVMRFHLDASGRAITRAEIIDRNVAIADEPTIGTIVGRDFVYVANTQWEKRDANGRPRPGVRLTAPVLLGVPLK